MQKFGTVCYTYRQDKKKLDSRSDKGIFVGYDKNSPAYMVYYPDSRKVMKHRLVRFMSNVEEQETDDVSDDDDVDMRYSTTRPDPDNQCDIPETRLGPSQISLQSGEVKPESYSPDILVEREGGQISTGWRVIRCRSALIIAIRWFLVYLRLSEKR